MSVVHSFDPIVDARARVLVLGSMPGRASLLAQEYYRHPRNAFWRIMRELFDFDYTGTYAERVQVMGNNGIAVWDVMWSCTRESSLDSDIVDDSIVPNDFHSLFAEYGGIERVFFNGAKAEHSFRRYVLPELEVDLEYERLPSTSPANAGMGYGGKLEAWRVLQYRMDG